MPNMQANRKEEGAWARRHNHALVALARQVWHEDCSLASAYAIICETAAETLEVERVNIWRCDAADALRCVHSYERSARRHNPPGFEETIRPLGDYAALLGEVRVIDAADVTAHSTLSASGTSLGDYLHRHDVRSLLDAPMRSEGELIGVVCHEQVGAARMWTPEDEAFAGSIGDYAAMAYETHRRRDAEGRLRYLELHDPHTDLPNRDHLLEVAHSALRPLHGDTAGVAAIHLQVDTLLHDDPEATDALLIAAADRLREEFCEIATLARVRSDAFALLPHRHLHETEALNLAERCIELVHEAARDAGAHDIQAAAGIAFSRDLVAPSADALLRNAELASQRARQGSPDRCEVFDAEHHRGLMNRLRTERALRDAVTEGRLEVHYQPEIDLRDGRWRAAEALLRWRDEQGRLHSASEFIEVAEASGQIVPLGRWVLGEACRVASAWPERDGAAPLLRVNVSARQFEQPGLIADVTQALMASGLPAERLCLELTETALLRDELAAAHTLSRLRGLGVGVALDDFGSGYSSLLYLKHLPIDALKLDQAFVAGLPTDRYDLAIVQAISTLARQVGIEVVAEGVETLQQADALRECGIGRAQGHLFAPAITADAVLKKFGGDA
ncbi:EAL domain-containing protein [Luteimonas gilva]|uniref:EAL domain-containing protein n=1 Tax=Luteimonas gilva TaxID=2572684 RepID=A0A4U5JM19_9GAMM|nr:EAL domain-containing protein [Luteimonas gilva]TKR30215.1 EAL domain-containing protein [Luteimonas gilva]